MTRYVLPDLPYDYDALEPHISGEIMALHHSKHHHAYVNGANDAIERLIEARRKQDLTHVGALERTMAFNVSGHVLHSILWRNLSPDGGGQPGGELGPAIIRDFGSFDVFKKQLVGTAATIMGSGWGALVWDPVSRRLGTTQIHDHENCVTQGGVPLLVIDAWEHAYYLQFQTDKGRYFEALFDLFNWQDVEQRYSAARLLDLRLSHVADKTPDDVALDAPASP